MPDAIVQARRLLRYIGRSCTYQRRTPLGRAPLIHARGQIRPFTLDQPAELRDAVAGLSRHLDARAMAGGIDLLNEMKCGSEVRHIVYLGKIADLRRIAVTREYIFLGANATHAEIERDANVASAIRQLPGIVRELGNIRIRAVGTIGGNLMAKGRYYDWLPILMALGAELSFGERNNKWFPAEMLISKDGDWRVPERLLKEIRIPLWGNPRLLFNRDLKPVISVAVCVRTAGDRRAGRVAVGCMHSAPVVRELEGFDELETVVPNVASRTAAHSTVPRLRSEAVAEAVGTRAANALPRAHEDGFAGSAYRQVMARTLITRALYEALGAE